jgi:hypothetical protein
MTNTSTFSDNSIDNIKDFNAAYKKLTEKLIDTSLHPKSSSKSKLLITNKSLEQLLKSKNKNNN